MKIVSTVSNGAQRGKRIFGASFIAACLVCGIGTASAAEIGSRNSSITLDLGDSKTAFITGLSEAELANVTATNFLSIIHPYDAEKTRINDSNLCWAATSANMLAYTGWGAVNGFQNEDDILAYFASNFNNNAGNPYYSNTWFITGDYNAPNTSEWAQPTNEDAGGFWPDADYSYEYIEINDESQKLNTMLNYLEDGYAISLIIGWYYGETRNSGHSVTLWGVTTDAEGNYLSLLVSDSDNNSGQGRDAPDTLNELFLSYNDAGNYYTFLNSSYQTGRLEGYVYLSALSAVPEPEITMMLSLGLVIMAVVKRRLRK